MREYVLATDKKENMFVWKQEVGSNLMKISRRSLMGLAVFVDLGLAVNTPA